jgi:hypothetical protein
MVGVAPELDPELEPDDEPELEPEELPELEPLEEPPEEPPESITAASYAAYLLASTSMSADAMQPPVHAATAHNAMPASVCISIRLLDCPDALTPFCPLMSCACPPWKSVKIYPPSDIRPLNPNQQYRLYEPTLASVIPGAWICTIEHTSTDCSGCSGGYMHQSWDGADASSGLTCFQGVITRYAHDCVSTH